ncbi:MAG TPA: glycosyltransferase family 1 protein [Gemmatimonadaceae bacterium]
MHIGVDAQRLAGQRLGVGRYIEYLLRHWAEQIRADERVSLFVRGEIDRTGLPDNPAFRFERLGPALTGKLWQSLVLGPHAGRLDVLFCPSYTAPWVVRGRIVVAIHSVNEVEAGTHGPLYRYTLEPIHRRSAHQAEVVIVPSLSTSYDLQSRYGVDPSKIEIIPQGADEVFRPARDEADRSVIRNQYFGEDLPFLLFVGKLSQRRNIPLLIEALGILRYRYGIRMGLLLFGPNHLGLPLDRLAAQHGVGDTVVQNDGRVANHRELVRIYNAAELYVNASAYEGFSMTLVEAMACGLPVVLTRRGALEEIAGEAGCFVEQPSGEGFAAALRDVLGNDTLRADLAARSARRGEGYRWGKFAQATLDVLRRVASGAKAAA